MAINNDFQIGNSFDSQTLNLGHAKKVWRRIDEQLPGGYHVTNMSDFASDGLIQAGMAVVKDTASGADARDVKVLTWAQIKTAVTGQSPAGIDSLNIIGFTQEDVPVYQHGTGGSATYNYGTCNIIVKGEIYGYMLGATVTDAATISASIKGMTQKNGLAIRVID